MSVEDQRSLDEESPPDSYPDLIPSSGKGTFGRRNTDAQGRLIENGSGGFYRAANELAKHPESLTPVVGPYMDMQRSYRAIEYSGSWDEAAANTALFISNGLFFAVDIMTLGTGEYAYGPARVLANANRRTATRTAAVATERGGAVFARAEAKQSARAAATDIASEKIKSPSNAEVIDPEALAELPPTDLVTSTHKDKNKVRNNDSKLNPESAHGGPTSALKKVPDYSRSNAVTVLLPKKLHRAWDSIWMSRAREKVRSTSSKTITVGELLSFQEEGLMTMVEQGKMSHAMAGNIQLMLHLEYFVTLKLDVGSKVRLPFSKR
jgi:hypothetical protein